MAIENNTILLIIAIVCTYFSVYKANKLVGSLFFLVCAGMFLYSATVGVQRMVAIFLIILSLVNLVYNLFKE